jgi:hypothetical protein
MVDRLWQIEILRDLYKLTGQRELGVAFLPRFDGATYITTSSKAAATGYKAVV